MWKKYKKKPIVIEAIQITKDMVLDNKLPKGTRLVNASHNDDDRTVSSFVGIVETLEGNMKFGIGDWIIKGVKGEFYPCKPDIFEASYNEVK